MLIDIQEKEGSIIFTIDGEVVELSTDNLKGLGMDAGEFSQILKIQVSIVH